MPEKPIFTDVLQVAVVVENLDEAIKKYSEYAGFDGWKVLEFNPSIVSNMIVRNKRQDYAMRLGLLNIGKVQWELIEPLDDESIYAEFLKEHGQGLHHIACAVSNYDEAMAFFEKKGIGIAQGGTVFGTTYTYLDTQDSLYAPIEIYSQQPDAEKESGRPEKPIFTEILQVAFVVKNLDEAVKKYSEVVGSEGWRILEFNPSVVSNMIVRDKRLDHAMRLGINKIGEVNLELIEPLDDKSIYAEFLKEHGEGFHHVACLVDDYEQTIAFFKSKGIGIAQGGTTARNSYTYLDTQDCLSAIIEIYSVPPGRG